MSAPSLHTDTCVLIPLLPFTSRPTRCAKWCPSDEADSPSCWHKQAVLARPSAALPPPLLSPHHHPMMPPSAATKNSHQLMLGPMQRCHPSCYLPTSPWRAAPPLARAAPLVVSHLVQPARSQQCRVNHVGPVGCSHHIHTLHTNNSNNSQQSGKR